jgi:hypothetical protein
MPRFYFNLQHDGKVTADVEGEELPDIDAAYREAVLVVTHLTKERLIGPRETLVVEVQDERGRAVLRAKVSLDVERPENLKT